MAKPAQSAAPKQAEGTAIVPANPGNTAVAAVPDWFRDYQGPLGTENIDTQDVNIPRLKIGQSMTPEVKDKLVNEGDLFHSITKEVIVPAGQAAIVIPVAYSKEYILWRDRQDGGGIFARARRVLVDGQVRYAWDKPNQSFDTKIKGVQKVTWKTRQFIEDDHLGEFGTMIPGDRDSLPAATSHFNYVLMLPEQDFQMVAVSFARSAAKKARDFNAMLKMGNVPMFLRRFNLGTVPDQNDKGDRFFNYSITPAGFVQDRNLFEQLMAMHNSLKEKGINVDFSDEEEGRANQDEADDRGKW